MKDVTIYTDGGCLGNPGPGGWAAILVSGHRKKELSGGDPATTNNRMEILAAIEALSALRLPCNVSIFTDSTYLRDGITKWIRGWKRNGWVTQSRQPVKNADLWRRLDAALSGHRVAWQWLRGHNGHPMNERCDVLARAAIEAIQSAHSPAALKAALDAFHAGRHGPVLPGF